MTMDPVCKMEVDPNTAQWTREYEGETYYFCAPGCKFSFEADPAKYLGGGGGHDHAHARGHGGQGHGHRWPWSKGR